MSNYNPKGNPLGQQRSKAAIDRDKAEQAIARRQKAIVSAAEAEACLRSIPGFEGCGSWDEALAMREAEIAKYGWKVLVLGCECADRLSCPKCRCMKKRGPAKGYKRQRVTV